MNDPAAAAAEPPATERGSGFFANLLDLYFAPGEAFAAMLRKPSFLAPMLLHAALSVAFTGVWLQKVDARAFFKARIEESGRADRIPPDRMDAILDQQARFLAPISWAAGALAPPVVVLALSGLFLFVYRFFYAGELRFPASLTVVASSFASVALVTTPLMLGVLALKGDWTIPPQEALQANLSLLLERQSTARPLWALASSLDLISFWLLFLLASGYGAAARRPWTWALAGVVVPWALFVAGKAALALAF